MSVKELVKKVRLELSEAVKLEKQGDEVIARACLSQANVLIEKYLRPFERYTGGRRKN